MIHAHPQSPAVMIEEDGKQERSRSTPYQELRQWYCRRQRNGKSSDEQLADYQVDRHCAAKVALLPLVNEATMRAALVHSERGAKQLPLAAYGTAQEQSSR